MFKWFKNIIIKFSRSKPINRYQLTIEESKLVRESSLFENMDQRDFKELLNSVQEVAYPANTQILYEGDPGDALYIIVSGSVRVYTLDSNFSKLALARLNAGDYFGEQALLGKTNKSRNANVETITDTTLLKIDKHQVIKHFSLDTNIQARLTDRGIKQAFELLTIQADFFKDINNFVQDIESAKMITFLDKEIIFNQGDQPTDAYIIYDGKIKIIKKNHTNNKFYELILTKGHLFGELSILENTTRAATAIASGDVKLIAISSKKLKSYYSKSPELQAHITALKSSYQIPLKGSIVQYTGKLKNIGAALTNVCKLYDGRTIISSRSLNKEIFSIKVLNQNFEKEYHYKNENVDFKVETADNKIIKINLYGKSNSLPFLCQALLERKTVHGSILQNFEKTGVYVEEEVYEEDEIVCPCMNVRKSQIFNLAESGITDPEIIAQQTGAGTVCQSCEYRINSLLGNNPWLKAKIIIADTHNDHIKSYFIMPTDGNFKTIKPGQYIVIQTEIDDNCVERPYSISNMPLNNKLRITMKTEDKGLFTSWLDKNAGKAINIQVTQPQGKFILNDDETKAAICFGGGIGITPFITFAHSIALKQNNKKLHILHAVRDAEDFVFNDEFEAFKQKAPNISYSYLDTNVSGHLTEDGIIALINEYNQPDVYICGPEAFTNFIYKTLAKKHYQADKIHIEQFVEAGVQPAQSTT